MNIESKLPRQRIPQSEKTEDWAKKTVKSLIKMSRFNKSLTYNDDLENMYKYYSGEIEDGDYSHVTTPFKSDNKIDRAFPAKIKNYNIIKPTVDRLLGEKGKRGLNFTVVNTNPDSVNAKKVAKSKFLKDLSKRYFLQELQKSGFPVDEETQELPELNSDSIDKMFNESYTDTKTINGQKALDYHKYNLELEDELIEGFKHFLISGCVATERGVNNDQVQWKIINPLNVDGDKDPDTQFWEDGDWVAYRKQAMPSSVVDYYYDDLTDKEILRLENPKGHYHSDFVPSDENTAISGEGRFNHTERADRSIEVIRVYWKTRKKVGFVSWTDDFGFTKEKIVEEGYEKAEDEELVWKWVNEVWEGHRIDGDIFVRLQSYPDQRWTLDNPSKCKLPINGCKYSTMNSGSISLVMLGVPYQLAYNIYKYRLELAIAKAKDRVAAFDINMIPKKWKPEDFMYWIESTGIAWMDYDKEGKTMSPQHQSMIDLTIQTIDKYISLLQSIILEWERISGVNAERAGFIDSQAGKAVTEQAIYQGSLITEDIYRKFSRFEQRELQAIMDYSKPAWRSGKRAQFIMPNGTLAQLDIDGGEDWQEAEYGVFVSSNAEDMRNLEQIKGSIQALIQNGASLSKVMEIVQSNSFADIKGKLEEIEEIEAKQEQKIKEIEAQENQAQRNHEMALEDREDQRVLWKIDADLKENKEDNETKKDVATINDRDE